MTPTQRPPLKAGDRVRLRGFAMVGGESSDVEGSLGTVTRILSNGRLEVRRDGDEWDVTVYLSQCRRLRPHPKPREVWMVETQTGELFAYFSKEEALRDCAAMSGSLVFLSREVLKPRREREE